MSGWFAWVWLGCGAGGAATPSDHDGETGLVAEAAGADVVAVRGFGGPDAWLLEVTVRSPDTGCERYADWWEVVTPEGELLSRRILDHSHVYEQPFTRDATEPLYVGADEPVVVRAHLHPDGYTGVAMRGTLAGGFTVDASLDASFAPSLSEAPPLPEVCLF